MGEIRLPSRSVAGAPRSRGRSAALSDAGDIAQVPLAKDPGLKIPEGAFGGGIGEAVGGFGDALADFGKAVERAGERQQKQFDATKTAESELGFDQITMAELGRWAKDQPGDSQSLGKLRTWLGTQEAEHLTNLDKNVSEGARTAHAIRLRAKSQTIADVADHISLKAATDGALKVIAAQTDQLAAQARFDPGLVRIFLGQGDERLQEFAGTLTPQAESQARTQLRAGVTRAAIDGLVQQDKHDEADALAESAKSNGDLDPAALARAMAEIQTSRRIATAEVQQRSAEHFAAIASTGQGVRGLANKAASVHDTAGKADFAARESGARAAYDDLQIVAFASPDQVDAAVERLKPPPGAPIEAQYRYTLFRDAAAQMLRERIANPAASAMKHPGVAEAYAAAAKDPTLLPAAITQLRAMQDAMGIAPDAQRILPDPYGGAADIAAMPTAEVPAAIDALRQQYGKHWGQAHGELVDAGLPAPYVVLGTLDEPQNAVARTELAAALTTGHAALANSIDPQQRAEVAGALDDALTPWSQTETTRSGAGAQNPVAIELAQAEGQQGSRAIDDVRPYDTLPKKQPIEIRPLPAPRSIVHDKGKRSINIFIEGWRAPGVTTAPVEGYKNRIDSKVRYYTHNQEKDVLEFIKQLPSDVQINLIGHSWGAAIATKVAAQSNRRIRALLTIDPVDRYPNAAARNRDGSKTRNEGGDRAWRTRNPGAIVYGDFPLDHGAIGVRTVAPFSDGRKLPDLAIFPDVETGWRAQRALLKGRRYQALTIDKVIERYSDTDRETYKKFVREALKLDGTTPMRDLTPEQFEQFLQTIQCFERSRPGTVREIPAPNR